MKIFKHRFDLKQEIMGINNLSFVPTMGGLHSGHKFLIKKARKKSKKVIVSIYVNPKQFNSKKDYFSYPRNLKKDLKTLKKLKVDIVYLPTFNDIFSFKPKNKIYLDSFSKKLCGKYRKRHFHGVINVVNRLLEIINPKFIFLGKKDFQQFYLIKKHIIKNKIKTKVVLCKTIREKNGVACSSRNENLNKINFLIASKVYSYLKNQKKYALKHKSFKLLKEKYISNLYFLGVTKVEYIDFLNLNTLKKPKFKKNSFNIFVSYYLNKTRLIDNF